MLAVIIFVCSGLLVYWVSRTMLLLHGSDEAIDDTLEECDLWKGRRLMLGLQTMFVPPQQFVGHPTGRTSETIPPRKSPISKVGIFGKQHRHCPNCGQHLYDNAPELHPRHVIDVL
jgi:hypothetical protein